MSPVVKLREGPDFAFGTRWALMQYHTWEDRHHFLDMPETEVQDYFRNWLESPGCPWYVLDQYLAENSSKLRGVRPEQSCPATGEPQGREEWVETEVAGGTSVAGQECHDEGWGPALGGQRHGREQ